MSVKKLFFLTLILCLTFLLGCSNNSPYPQNKIGSEENTDDWNNSFLKDKITNMWKFNDYTLIEVTDGYDRLYYLQDKSGEPELIGGAAYDLEYAKYENNKVYFIAHRINEGSIVVFPYYMLYDLETRNIAIDNLSLTLNDVGYWGQCLSTPVLLQEVSADQENNIKLAFYPADKNSLEYGTNPLVFFPFTKSFYDKEKNELVFSLYNTIPSSDLKVIENEDSSLVGALRIEEKPQKEQIDIPWWFRGFNISEKDGYSVTEVRLKLKKPVSYRLKENNIQSSMVQEDKYEFTLVLEP